MGSYPAKPAATDLARRIQAAAPVICQFCHRRVHCQRNGAWYHSHNASVSCHPGEGTGRCALPAGA